ncbi:MAG: 50S ribosomal protein L11 methyltransferase, partial [Actinobacteria bacterium]|nr:50S ribosomal protein L11 methyltransferase [Actinomycetota bacterium]
RLVADLPARALDRLDGPYEVLEHDPSWDDAWRDHATAVPVGDRLLLRPEWVTAEPADAGRVEIVLDAAHAFGSGSHPTTRVCVEALEGLADELAGARVLDVGSGTGVLGVAALVLGAGSLVAVDVDSPAVAATDRTAELNGVSDRLVEVSSRTVAEVSADHGPFDVVVANLLIPIIETLGPDLAAAVAPGGRLILSGLLADPSLRQVDRALAAIGSSEVWETGGGRAADLHGWVAVKIVRRT